MEGYPLPHEPRMNDIERPDIGDRVTFPFPIVARVGQPGDPRGLVIGLLNWASPQDPPATAQAVVELHNSVGELLAWREVMVLGPRDPSTCTIGLF
jgi:hypothetical protein